MPIYEGEVVFKETRVRWCFAAPDMEEAQMRLHEKIDDLIDDVVIPTVTKAER